MMSNHMKTSELNKELYSSEDGFRMEYTCWNCGFKAITTGKTPTNCPKCGKEHSIHPSRAIKATHPNH